MKVVLLNGSRREAGCTYTALSVVADVLKENGVDAEIIHAVPTDDVVKAVAEKVKEADGLVVGSPVYWASPSGEIISFMDRLAGMADPQTGRCRRIGSPRRHDSYAGRTE